MTTVMASLITSDRSITMVIDGAPYTVRPDHPSYAQAYKAYKERDGETFINCLNVQKAVETFVQSNGGGKVTVKDGQVYYNGNVIDDCIAERIRNMMREGEDFGPMVLFLENIMQNPSFNSRKQLYQFLSHENLPITDDGCFLAYKTIRGDWYDKHSGTIKNSVGSTIRIDRSLVDDNPNNHCSHGLHVGALSYAGPGGWYNSSGDRVIIVKVNPRDAVSVPGDHSAQKLRVCEYQVYCEYKEPLYRSTYSTSAGEDVYTNNTKPDDDYVVTDEDLYADDDLTQYLDPEDVEVGEYYTFSYTDRNGDTNDRSAYVESIGEEYFVGELQPGDPSYVDGEGIQYRHFLFNSMASIERVDW